MTALRSRFRAWLLVEHLEDRSQPAALSMTPLAGAGIVDPVVNLTPAIAGDRVAGTPNATSPGAVSEPTLFILFGPDDVEEFAILVEPSQTPPLPAETALSLSVLEQEVGLRVVFVAVDFPGNNNVDFFNHHVRLVDQGNPSPNPQEAAPTLPPPLPNHPALGSDLDPLLIPAGAVNAVNMAQAPMPRAVEGPAIAPPVETAPPPREVRPEKNDPNPVSFAVPSSASVGESAIAAPATAITAAPLPPVTEATSAAVEEQPQPAGRSWGFFGVCAAAISAGGYWLLHHSAAARAAKALSEEKPLSLR